jgi:hypothetical protein
LFRNLIPAIILIIIIILPHKFAFFVIRYPTSVCLIIVVLWIRCEVMDTLIWPRIPSNGRLLWTRLLPTTMHGSSWEVFLCISLFNDTFQIHELHSVELRSGYGLEKMWPILRCSCISILWVSLVSFPAITISVASQRVFLLSSSFNSLSTQSGNVWIHPRICILNWFTLSCSFLNSDFKIKWSWHEDWFLCHAVPAAGVVSDSFKFQSLHFACYSHCC